VQKLKSHKSVEQIARKHRMDVSDIQKQLDMGEPIEHEHTKNHKLAMDIALQHLDEFPDYYTRLKKMEASAKKEHKKFKDVKEATDGIKARDYNGRLDKWFDDGGWVQTGGKYDGKPCAKQPGQTTKPYCRDPDDRAAMDEDERDKRAAKKRKEDPNPNRSGEAKMVTQESAGEKDACYKKVKSRYKVWPSAYASGALVKCRKVGADSWGTKTEEIQMVRYCPKCEKEETRDECKYGPKYWDMFSTPVSLASNSYDPNKPHPANEEKDHEYSMARSELSTIISAVKRLKKKMGKGEGNVEAWVQSKITKAADYIDTAADYVDSGEMKSEGVSFNIGSDHTNRRTTNASKKLQKMTTAQQGQLPSQKVKQVLGTDIPRFNKEETSVDEEYRNIARKAGAMTQQAAKSGVTAGGARMGARALRTGGVRNAIRKKFGLSPKQRNHPGADELDTIAKEARRRAATITAVQASHKPGVAQDQEAINRKRGVEKNREKIKNAYNQSESVTIEDANGNYYAEFIDIIKPEPLKPSKGIGSDMLDEAGKKCWPGYKKKGTQKLFGKTYNRCVKEGKTFSSFIDEAKKSEMKCNSPKAEPVGDSLTGKSHVVKACAGGKEKLIRFGQRGVKGSPKKKGESKAYASRRNRFQTRHAKNIAKGPMSAAYWANKVKW